MTVPTMQSAQFGKHGVTVFRQASGWWWTCTCGKALGEAKTRASAKRKAEAHGKTHVGGAS